jgi:RNA polymerase sigma factor for flagellar operon FliA
VPTSEREQGEKLFLDHLATIEKVIHFVSLRASVRDAEEEDFSSHVTLRLIENDYKIIRQFSGSSFTAYISTVIHRLLLDYRIQNWGKFHASSEARRIGPLAVALEMALHRDGKSITEALPTCRRVDPSATAQTLEALAMRLPRRFPKVRLVPIDGVADEVKVPPDSIIHRALDVERTMLSRNAAGVIKAEIEQLPEDERVLLRLHYGADMTLAEVARALKVEQKPLYRRVKRALAKLRRRLEIAGIKSTSIEEIVAGCAGETDFGLGMENNDARPSLPADRKDEKSEDRD